MYAEEMKPALAAASRIGAGCSSYKGLLLDLALFLGGGTMMISSLGSSSMSIATEGLTSSSAVLDRDRDCWLDLVEEAACQFHFDLKLDRLTP